MKYKNNKNLEKKILMIVDDDKDDRFFFLSAIHKNNPSFQCIEAENGVDALKQLRNLEDLPDFIFLDLNMPKMDGKQCLEELKKDKNLKNIPIVIYTTSEYKLDKEVTEKLGADYFFTKLSDIYMLPEELTIAMNEVAKII